MRYFIRSLQVAPIIWLALTVEIIATSFLYAVLSVSGLSEDASLLIAFATLGVLIILSFLLAPKSFLSLKDVQGVTLSLPLRRRRSQRNTIQQRQLDTIEQLISTLQRLTPSLDQQSSIDLSKVLPLALLEKSQADDIAHIKEIQVALPGNTEQLLQSLANETIELTSTMNNQVRKIDYLTQALERHQESIEELIQSLNKQQQSVEQNTESTARPLSAELVEQVSESVLKLPEKQQKALILELRKLVDEEQFEAFVREILTKQGYVLQFSNKQEAASIYKNLGEIYSEQQRFAEAEALYKRALEIFLALNNVSDTAAIFKGLGELYRKQNRFTEAEVFYRKALEMFGS